MMHMEVQVNYNMPQLGTFGDSFGPNRDTTCGTLLQTKRHRSPKIVHQTERSGVFRISDCFGCVPHFTVSFLGSSEYCGAKIAKTSLGCRVCYLCSQPLAGILLASPQDCRQKGPRQPEKNCEGTASFQCFSWFRHEHGLLVPSSRCLNFCAC